MGMANRPGKVSKYIMTLSMVIIGVLNQFLVCPIELNNIIIMVS